MEERFTCANGLKSSINKAFSALGNIASEPFRIEFELEGKRNAITYQPPRKIIVSENLFRQYNCLEYACSRCCWKIRDWNIFTPKQYAALPRGKKAKERIQALDVLVNGARYGFTVEDNTKEVCQHLEANKCGIHEYNPVHCALPLIKFRRVHGQGRDTTYVTREVYTRNWFMQCPVQFKPITKEGYDKTLFVLGRVKGMAEELGIETRIDGIIGQVESRAGYHNL